MTLFFNIHPISVLRQRKYRYVLCRGEPQEWSSSSVLVT
jgi:hypothetical protein